MATVQEEIKNFVQRATITTNSQEAVTEYFLSKQQDRNIKKYPEWDKPRVYPALEVVRAHSEDIFFSCYMNDVRDRMRKHVAEYKKYQDYLDMVIIETGEFNSISEIFNRYETLIEARSILSEHQDKNLELLEEKGTEMHHMTESKSQKIMTLNNKLAQLQARRDRAEVQARKWETIVAEIKVIAAEKNLEHTQVKTCCWNLYQQICKRKEIPVTVSKDDVEQQLDYIKRTILELKRIMKVAKKHATK
ncbi:Coiled-coil domain-containing protein 42 like-2 [Melipona quadrifasciata]|uniref:Coiled-coil domain-containing protein 42 like-2 n=1 Tax=Melipona quadrifasciata TaxID=166423 RepID=A0A0N0BFN6_9HYME|nr:Coiled-coil domain-containing protein 42 like-2 [Melipona quadrifasciata]